MLCVAVAPEAQKAGDSANAKPPTSFHISDDRYRQHVEMRKRRPHVSRKLCSFAHMRRECEQRLPTRHGSALASAWRLLRFVKAPHSNQLGHICCAQSDRKPVRCSRLIACSLSCVIHIERYVLICAVKQWKIEVYMEYDCVRVWYGFTCFASHSGESKRFAVDVKCFACVCVNELHWYTFSAFTWLFHRSSMTCELWCAVSTPSYAADRVACSALANRMRSLRSVFLVDANLFVCGKVTNRWWIHRF